MNSKLLIVCFIAIASFAAATYNGKPPAPSSTIVLSGTACRTSLTLEWGPSLGDQNTAEVLKYELQRDEGTTETKTDPTGEWTTVFNDNAVKATVTGLTADRKYLFRVRGVNADGNGEWRYSESGSSKVQIATSANRAPDKPAAPTVKWDGSSALTITFSALETCASDITGYELRYKEGSTDVSSASKGTLVGARDLILEREVSGLTASTAHKFAVIAYIGDTESADPAASTNTNLAHTTLGTLKITALSASSGPLEGNTLVTVTGNHFTKGIKCKFGINDLVDATEPVVTDNAANPKVYTTTCRTPRGTSVRSTQVYMNPNNAHDVNSAAAPTKFSYRASMFVSDFKESSVHRFDAVTGDFVDTFVKAKSGELDGPWGHGFNPEDKNFLVASEGTSDIKLYNGNNGDFMKVFCTVKGQPRGFAFHKKQSGTPDTHHDLYVASAYNDKVYRFNGKTGAARGVYAESDELDAPWQVMFARRPASDVDLMFVSSEYTDNIHRFSLPPDSAVGPDIYKGVFKDTLTKKKVNYVNGFSFTEDSLYATGPYSGKAIVRFDRSTGDFIDVFIDENLTYPVDLKIFFEGDEPSETDPEIIYVCSEHEVRKYDRITGEFLGVHAKKTGMVSSYLSFHKNWNDEIGY